MVLRSARLLAGGFTAFALLCGVQAPASASSDYSPRSLVFTVMGEGGWIIGQGTAAYEPPGHTELQVIDHEATPGRDFMTGTAVFPGDRWSGFRISAPSADPKLKVGRYVTSNFDPPPLYMLFDIGYHSRGCNTAYGEVDILEVTRDADGLIDALALDYTLLCGAYVYPDPSIPPVHGSIRINSDVPYRYTWMGQLHTEARPGETVRDVLTLTNKGTESQVFGTSTWEPAETPADQPPLTIERDGCADITLEPGEQCSIEVSAFFDGTRELAGHVRTPDGTRRGAAFSPVRVTLNPPPTPTPFSDVPANHQFAPGIAWLADAQIATGYADGTFRPTAAVSRQAFAAYLYRYTRGGPPPVCTQQRFPDVPVDDAFCGHITWLADTGITQGYDDGTFRPTAPVSRQAVAAFLQRYRETNGPTSATCEPGRFTDLAAGEFCAAITWLADTGITDGYDDGTFRPTAPVSRQALATYLLRYNSVLGPSHLATFATAALRHPSH